MTPGIEITDTELTFTEFPSKDIGLAKYCKSFNLSLNEIELIGISPRLSMDDESIFILVIDKSKVIHLIPDLVLGTKGFEKFENHFMVILIKEILRNSALASLHFTNLIILSIVSLLLQSLSAPTFS